MLQMPTYLIYMSAFRIGVHILLENVIIMKDAYREVRWKFITSFIVKLCSMINMSMHCL
jgi:hypothetical protein